MGHTYNLQLEKKMFYRYLIFRKMLIVKFLINFDRFNVMIFQTLQKYELNSVNIIGYQILTILLESNTSNFLFSLY